MFVLVNPPFVELWRPNLGLALLKATLRDAGHPCTVFHAEHRLAALMGLESYTQIHSNHGAMLGEWLFSGFVRRSGRWDSRFLDWVPDLAHRRALRQWCTRLSTYLDEVATHILSLNPKVVGCSSTFQQNNASLALLRRIKEQRPSVVTVMGGANLEGELGEPLLGFPWLDFIVSGEAEDSVARFYELCCRYGAAIPPSELPPEVGTISRVARRGRMETLDRLPYPDFDDYYDSLASYSEFRGLNPLLTLEGSRGCWWGQVQHCTFCGLNGSGMNYRAKSPARLLEEIRFVSARYGAQHLQMVDNIIAPKHLQEVLPQLAREKSERRFFWEVKANLKASHFEIFREAGVHWLQPGIESFSDATLQLMRKGQRALQNMYVLKAARENGIKLFWNLLLGHPGERAEHVREQRERVRHLFHLQPPSDFCQVRADRFSPLYTENPELEPYAVYSYIYELSPAELRKIAYYFSVPASTDPEYETEVNRFRQVVEEWRSRESSLCFRGERVLDSRAAAVSEYSLSSAELELLRRCVQPTRLSELSGERNRLRELGLLVEDENQALSLVLERDTAGLPPLPPDPLTRSGTLDFSPR